LYVAAPRRIGAGQSKKRVQNTSRDSLAVETRESRANMAVVKLLLDSVSTGKVEDLKQKEYIYSCLTKNFMMT
jgi:hypothetical protein